MQRKEGFLKKCTEAKAADRSVTVCRWFVSRTQKKTPRQGRG